MSRLLLQDAVDRVLACPFCRAHLILNNVEDELSCEKCEKKYPVIDGIANFIVEKKQNDSQKTERDLRNKAAHLHENRSAEEILSEVRKHHSYPVMKSRAHKFRAFFGEKEWIADVGTGVAWHWAGSSGADVVAMDFCLESLNAARKLLSGSDRVLLICADAKALPFRDDTISGIWSVQVFQHLPKDVLERVFIELDRILSSRCLIEIYNLNPAPLKRVLYGLLGKDYHLRGMKGEMELNRLAASGLLELWGDFRSDRVKREIGYSELFFHPEISMRPSSYPVGLETLLQIWPRLTGLFARQIHIKITG